MPLSTIMPNTHEIHQKGLDDIKILSVTLTSRSGPSMGIALSKTLTYINRHSKHKSKGLYNVRS